MISPKVATRRIDRLLELLSIDGGPGHESAVAEYLTEQALAAGVEAKRVASDAAHKKIGFGERGNLIVKLGGRGMRASRRMLSAHMDTVPLCVGNQPKVDGDWIRGVDPSKALGGDDRSGCAVLLSILCELAESEIEYPPLTFLWSVQEEVGLRGAKNINAAKLGQPSAGFNFDGRSPSTIVTGATGDIGIEITIHGLASHAGVRPEGGTSAAIVFARALHALVEDGWHGQIRKGRQTGTSNVGVLSGGAATNVVMDSLTVRAEVRSHSKTFRAKILKAWRSAFERAAAETVSADGHSASIEWQDELKYEAFALSRTSPVVRMAKAAVKQIGLDPELVVGNGGLDANWLTENGIPTVTFGCGQHGIHTVEEKLHVPSYLQACDLGWHIATSGE